MRSVVPPPIAYVCVVTIYCTALRVGLAIGWFTRRARRLMLGGSLSSG